MAGDARPTNKALAAISANLHPGHWVKTDRAEENLRSFNQWFNQYERWTNVCIRGVALDDSMKWDILIAPAGPDLHHNMKEAGIETRKREARNSIQNQDTVEAVEEGENGNPPARNYIPEQPYVPRSPPSHPQCGMWAW